MKTKRKDSKDIHFRVTEEEYQKIKIEADKDRRKPGPFCKIKILEIMGIIK